MFIPSPLSFTKSVCPKCVMQPPTLIWCINFYAVSTHPPTQKHSRAISNTHTHLQCTQLVDIAASCPGVDTPLPLSDTFLRIFDRIFRRIFSKWAQLTWARALQRLVLETWYAREIDPWTRKHCQKQNRQITFGTEMTVKVLVKMQERKIQLQ